MAIEWPDGWVVLPWGAAVFRADLCPCGDCGRPDRVLYTTPLPLADGTATVRGHIACPACLPPPAKATVRGTLDTATGLILEFGTHTEEEPIDAEDGRGL